MVIKWLININININHFFKIDCSFHSIRSVNFNINSCIGMNNEIITLIYLSLLDFKIVS